MVLCQSISCDILTKLSVSSFLSKIMKYVVLHL
uniref:Uncharacterized protein n=1 Tax=Rhizophora mucronata TaxID=61149 RepID=A0A2P2PYS6_RHIMU